MDERPMTVAIDAHGKVLGQVIDRTPDATLERDPGARRLLLLLTAKGYTTVQAASVRLEKV
jgi:hypothetical protein